jgi:N-acyl-L-homoserine lactone synthetase
MVALIDTSRQHACETAMRRMFEARKQIFVDLLGWDVPVLDGRFEIDQFDDAHARYLILTDESLVHLGSARLLPTTRPHILNSLFPSLCSGPIPVGPAIFEITRFCLSRALTSSGRREVRNRLITALAQHALDHGIATYTGVAEPPWLRQILAFGWKASQLGQPRPGGGCQLAALRIDITAETEERLAATGIWHPTNRQVAPAERARTQA